MGTDGNIYAIPANATQVLRIELSTSTVSLIGPELHPRVKNKWYGGIKGRDGSIWGVPYNAPSALCIVPHPTHPTVSEVGAFACGGWKWHGGARCHSTGRIVGIPSHANEVLIIIPEEKRCESFFTSFPSRLTPPPPPPSNPPEQHPRATLP